MQGDTQTELLSPIKDVDIFRILLADLHDDLPGKTARYHQLSDLAMALGPAGTMLPGGETALATWMEARSSFVHGNFVATVILCQGLAEHLLAAHLSLELDGKGLPARISFQETLDRSLSREVITSEDAVNLRRLAALRNPLSHYRSIEDISNLSRRAVDSRQRADVHLLSDATFAISVAVRLLSLPPFRLDN